MTVSGLSQFVAFKHEGLGTRLDRAFGGGEVRMGDEAFDRALYLQGDERLFRALLDAPTRRLVLEAFSGVVVSDDGQEAVTVTLANGTMQAAFADRLGTDAPPRPETVRRLLELARRLQEPTDVTALIVANAHVDPIPDVRRQALRTLERTAPQDPATRAAMQRSAQADADAEIRLYAALWLDRDGWAVLDELAADITIDDWISARATETLGEHIAFDRASRTLGESLAKGRLLTARASVKALGWAGEMYLPTIAAALANRPEVAEAAASALGQTGSASAEAPLIAALGPGTADLRTAAAAALGHVGSAESVQPLRELARSSRGEMRAAALGAILRIQRRLTGADPGQLSMVETGDGQLALAEDAQGRVTFPGTSDR
jgi:HEAT repeat protein